MPRMPFIPELYSFSALKLRFIALVRVPGTEVRLPSTSYMTRSVSELPSIERTVFAEPPEYISNEGLPALPTMTRFACGVDVPIPTCSFASTTSPVPPTVNKLENKFVDDAVVANKFVVVALVPVAFRNVKFWRVVDPVTRSCPPSFANVVFGSK